MADSQSTSRAAPRALTAKDWRDKGLDPNAYRKVCQTIFKNLREIRERDDLPSTVRDSIDSAFIDLSRELINVVIWPLARKRGKPPRTPPKMLFTEYVNPLLTRSSLPCFRTYIRCAAAESKTRGETSLRAIAEILADLLPTGRRGRRAPEPGVEGIINRERARRPDAKRVVEDAIKLLTENPTWKRKRAVITALNHHSCVDLDHYLKRLSEVMKQVKRS